MEVDEGTAHGKQASRSRQPTPLPASALFCASRGKGERLERVIEEGGRKEEEGGRIKGRKGKERGARTKRGRE